MPNYFTELQDGPSGPSYKIKDEANTSAIEAVVNVNGCCNIWGNTWETHTRNGITFTKNTDGTITLSGISTVSFDEYITPFKITKGSYIFCSGVPKSVYHQQGVGIISGTLGYGIIGEREEHTFSEDTNFDAYLHFESGVDLTTPIIFKPMIHDARLNPTGYVPYAMTNRELTDRIQVVTKTVTIVNGYAQSTCNFTPRGNKIPHVFIQVGPGYYVAQNSASTCVIYTDNTHTTFRVYLSDQDEGSYDVTLMFLFVFD